MATKIHAIEKELASALKIKRKDSEKDAAFAARLHEAAAECAEEVWEGLSCEDAKPSAQGWVNAYTTAKDNEMPLPDFDYDPSDYASAGIKFFKKEGRLASEDAPEDKDEVEQAQEVEGEVDEAAVKTKSKGAKDKAAKDRPAKAPSKASGKAKAPAKDKEAAPRKGPANAKKAAKQTNGSGTGYKGHREGSRKGKVHELYDEKGGRAAFDFAVKLGIAESTARSWIGSWGGFGKD